MPKADTSRPCACGCGGRASGDTQRGRTGLYVSGHNTRVAHPFEGKSHTDETRRVIAQKARDQAARQFPAIANHNPRKAHPGAHGSWHWMMSRCFDSWNASYPSYGGRGITVCAEWLTFDGFFADMGERPEGMTIERIDGNGNYEPGNCRWATKAEQDANRSDPWETRRAKYGSSGRIRPAKKSEPKGKKEARVNECGHPERPHLANGKCRSCYGRDYRRTKAAAPG